MSDFESFEFAASRVARLYGAELAAAAKCLARSAPNDLSFMRVWLGIGELARMGALDIDASSVAASFTMAPESAQKNEEGHDG